MTKIQVDLPDELLDRIRKSFEKHNNSKIPIPKSHLVRWFIERHIKDIPEKTLETPKTSEEVPTASETPETSVVDGEATHERTQSLEEILDEIDELAAANSETIV